MADSFDIVFLGGGPAGYQGAIRAAQLGQRVAVIEDRDLGGVCLNRGCIPTKAIRSSVHLLNQARQAKSYGLDIPEVRPDIKAIIARKDKIVSMIRGGVAQLFRANRIALLEGRGRLLSPRELEVETAKGKVSLAAQRIVIATGSRAALPPPFDRQARGIMTTDEILSIQEIPRELVIVGAGAVGVEMAAIMASLGSSVTLLEAKESILPGEDREMANYLARMLKRQKVKVMTGVTVTGITEGSDLSLTLSDGKELKAGAVLVAAGRKPNVEGIGLKDIGLPEAGPIQVNERMETGIPGVYAAGDVAGGWLLAHVAFAEGTTAAETASGLDRVMDYRVVPRCIFSFPEYAAVGLTEEQAKEQCPAAAAFSFPFKSLGMAQALGEWEGMVKLVVNEETGEILGGHIIGAHAAELIAEVALAMKMKATVRDVADTIHTHPTMAEAVLETAQAALGQAIHILPDRSKAE